MTDYQWPIERRIMAEDEEAVIIEEVCPVDGTIEETPFCYVDLEPKEKKP